MDEHQRPNGIPVTRFTLQSIYAQSDDEKLEFEYESGNTNILVRWHLHDILSIIVLFELPAEANLKMDNHVRSVGE